MLARTLPAAFVWLALVSGSAFALKSDKDQPSNIDADYQKSVQSKTGAANDPDVTDLDGNVVLTKGSIKMTAAHAHVLQIPSAANDDNAGKISRVILTGKLTQAHMQQVHDGDCALMTADADRIDYNPLTYIAELTGKVHVVQAGRGEFRGEHMTYNTDTGDMEAGSAPAPSADGTANAAASPGRIHMVMEASTAAPPASTNNCGFPAAPAPAKNPAASGKH